MSGNRFVSPDTEDVISQLAQDETGKRQYYRPVYSLHKWWARRPGALFRSIILRASEPDKKLFVKDYGLLSRHSHYFQDHNLDHTIILDPFMGGGTTLAEANRLGAKVIGCDLNPVSFWVVRETLKPINLKKLTAYFKQLEQIAGEKIKSLYSTACIHCHSHAEGLYTFWVRYVKCLHCDKTVYLFKRTLLNKGLSRNKPASRANPATVFCPNCFELNQKKKVNFESLSLIPTDVLARAMDDLASQISTNSDNKLFLHFMGELLRTASSVPEGESVDYHWFAETLTHFDDFLAGIEREEKEDDRAVIKFQQLRLLESASIEYED